MFNKEKVLKEIATRKAAAIKYCSHAPHLFFVRNAMGWESQYPDCVWQNLPAQNAETIARHKPNYAPGTVGERFLQRAGTCRADHFEMVIAQGKMTVSHQGTGNWHKSSVVHLTDNWDEVAGAWSFSQSGRDYNAPSEEYENPYEV